MNKLSKEDKKALVDTINSERQGLRTELIEYQKAMYGAILAFVTAGGVAANIHFGKPTTSIEPSNAPLIVFLLSQVEYFLTLFGVALISGQSMHAGYISALEKHLNSVIGTKVSIWESEVVPRYMSHPRGSFFWINLILIMFLVGIFGTFAYFAISDPKLNQMIYGIVLTIEWISVIALLIWSQLDTQRVSKFATQKFLGRVEATSESTLSGI